MPVAAPPASFASHPLVTHLEPAGRVWRRLYPARHPDPLGFTPATSRFSDPTGAAFGVVYLGSSMKVAFHEAILRDRADARTGRVPIGLRELQERICAALIVEHPLRLVDLTRDGPLKMGVPSDVAGARDQTAARIWSAAFHAHPESVDGVHYPSRLNEERCIALYDRAIAKVVPQATPRLIDLRDELAAIIQEFELEIDPAG